MDIFTLSFWGISLIMIIKSFFKSKNGTLKAMKKSRRMMGSMMGDIVAIIFIIGLILAFIPPEVIKDILGNENWVFSSFLAAIAGSITLIPAFVAFPLVGSFVKAGASIIPGAAFLTTLTMVGIVTFPLEKKKFGLKFAVLRNLFSFFGAIIIAILMGVILQ